LLLDPSFADLDPAENDTFLRKTKIRDTTFLGGEVKPRSYVVRFYGMLKNLTRMKRDTS
jgi:hypothetical protein